MRRLLPLAALLALAIGAGPGCARRKLGPADGGARDTGAALDSGGAGGDGAVDAAAGEVATDAAGEVGPDAVPPTGAVLESFVRMREEIERSRFVECFGAGPGPIASYRFAEVPVLDYDLRVGLVTIDQAAIESCLATARTASCAAVAAGAIEDACDHVLVGQVPDGGFCINAADCAGPGAGRCAFYPFTCGSRCAPGPGPGFKKEGTPCDGSERCLPGLACVLPGPTSTSGVCRARAPGGACDGKWDCPFPFTCVFDGTGRAVCDSGRRSGEPCKLYGLDAPDGPYHECAISLGCYPDASGALHCGEGVGLGAACGKQPPTDSNPKGDFIPCRTGRCETNQYPSLCVPYREEGEGCIISDQCAEHLTCWEGTCRRPATTGFAAGQACGGDAFGYCAQDAFCSTPAGDATFYPPGTCRTRLADGQPCTYQGQCQPTSDCVAGTCSSCR
jgi:hypothetical protein